MPIRPDLRELYPSNWQEIRIKILSLRAMNCCEWCGIKDRDYGIRDDQGKFYPSSYFDQNPDLLLEDRFAEDAFTVVLTIAHLDHDVTNNDGMELGGPPLRLKDANLVALCCQCHNRHDGPHRGANKVRTWDRKRGQGRFNFGETE